MPCYSVLEAWRLSGFILLFLLPSTQGYHFFPPPEVGTLQFANRFWTVLCVVSVELGRFPVASTCICALQIKWAIMWICKILFLAVPARSAVLLGLPSRGLWEDSNH